MQVKKITLSEYHDIRYKSAKEIYPVKLRVTCDRKQWYYHTGVNLSVKDYEKMNSRRPGDLDKKFKDIQELRVRANSIIDKMGQFDFVQFRAKMEGKEAVESVEAYFNRYIKQLHYNKQIKTMRNYECALNSFELFRPGLMLRDITDSILKEYKTWMLSKDKKLTTISIYTRCLRTIINKAISANEFPRDLYPFGRYKFLVPAPRSKKNPLSSAQFDALAEYVTDDPVKAYARDMWLLSFYCGGRNAVDLLYLKYKNVTDKTITFPYRQKTKDSDDKQKPLVVKIHDDIRAILDRWAQKNAGPETHVLNVLNDKMEPNQMVNARMDFGKACNDGLALIAADLNIPSIKMQQARHTAFNELRRAGKRFDEIRDVAGHTNIKTTELYMESLNVDSGNETLDALRSRKSKLKAV